MTELTAEKLRELVSYNPETGEMRWLVQRGSRGAPGTLAGCARRDGYRSANIDGISYLIHRLAWLYMYGKWPDGVIDHINRDCTDNSISNLRDTTIASNTRNQRAPQKNNTSGIRGVTFNKAKRKWAAYLQHAGSTLYLGLHASKEDAHLAYLKKKNELHPEAFAVG